jgi:hypothetical protein
MLDQLVCRWSPGAASGKDTEEIVIEFAGFVRHQGLLPVHILVGVSDKRARSVQSCSPAAELHGPRDETADGWRWA